MRKVGAVVKSPMMAISAAGEFLSRRQHRQPDSYALRFTHYVFHTAANIMPKEITSGSWQSDPLMDDYRSERFTDMFVERATWTEGASTVQIGDVTIAAPGYIWFRFWLLDVDQVVEKYFADDRQPVGIYVPTCMPLEARDDCIAEADLVRALWLDLDGRITVLHEGRFDSAVAEGELTSAESEHAELRIRDLTLGASQKLFPPAMVRRFILKSEGE